MGKINNRLLGKSQALEDANYFCPYCFDLMHRQALYFNSEVCLHESKQSASIQKSFSERIPGCTEHHMKLWSAILNAKSNQKSLAVAWDVLANAFGSINHKLIHLELQQHNAPAQLCEIVANFTVTYLYTTVVTRNSRLDHFSFQIVIFL